MAKSSTEKVISTVEEWFSKLPELPKGGREFIVKVTPWFALIFGILGILVGVGALGVLGTASPLIMAGGGAQSLGGGIIGVLIGLASSVLLLAAFPGTKKHKEKGWRFLLYSEAVNLVAVVLGFSLVGILFSLLGFYLIFQIKSYYK